MKRKFLYFTLVVGGILQGCASTQIRGFKDPDFTNKTFKRIIVASGLKKEWHEQLVNSITSRSKTMAVDVEFIEYGSLFFPTRTYSNEDIKKIVDEQGIDGFLFLTLQDAGTENSYVPQYQSQTTVTPNYYGGYTANTYNYGGYDISKPYFSFNMELIDAGTSRKAWVAEASSGGNAFAGWSDLISSMSGKIIDSLVSEGLVKSEARPLNDMEIEAYEKQKNDRLYGIRR
jgi:hypothetical protein